MNCHECADILHRRLDGELLPATSGLDQHLAECATCRGLFAAARSLQEGLRGIVAPTMPPLFAARTTARVLAARRRARLRRWAVAGAALAASVMFAVWYFGAPAPLPPANTKVVEATKPSPLPAPAPAPAPKEPSLRDAVQEARTALDGLTDKVLANTREQADVLR